MNVNPRSEDFTNVVPWDSLTEEQQKSGDWILLPDVSGEPRRARKDEISAIQRLFESRGDSVRALELRQRQFDANGRPR